MSFNEDVAARFEQMAALLELVGENKFRVNAHAKAARVVEDHATDLRAAAEAGDVAALTALDGVGKGTAEKIIEFARTGVMEEHVALLARVPAGVITMMRVPGVGPKTAKAIWETLGVTDLAGLKAAVESGAILTVPRMGEKAAAKIRENLSLAESAGKRLHLGVASLLAERIVAVVRAVPGVARAEAAGSLRRGAETVGDIDVLAVAEGAGASAAVHEAFRTMPGVVSVVTSGESKTSVRVQVPDVSGRWKGFAPDEGETVQADLRVVPAASFGAALMYFTGSKAHNVKMRERALARGLTLNEYGLFPEDTSTAESPQKRGVAAVAGRDEAEVFCALGLGWVPPEAREDRGEFSAYAEEKTPPRLVEVADIKAELHAHTTDSDGRQTLAELVQRAKGRGFHTIAVTDHSASSAQAGGLTVERLREQRRAIEAHRRVVGQSIRVLCGSEVDILSDGRLDYEDDVLASLDVVVASPHTALDQEPAKATARLLKAIENPFVHVLGHPSGRIIARRKGLEPAWNEIFAAAAEHNVALEINAHWLRLDLRDTLVAAALAAGCLIAIDCDVHAADDFDNLRYGVATGRRGGLTAERCVNCWEGERLWGWLRGKR